MGLQLLRWVSILGAIGGAVGSAIVTDVEPRRIGYGGGAITIHGSGFSEDVFNQFDPVLGNKVWFANEFVSVPCQNPINWNFLLENPQDPSTTKITCDLPPREGSEGSNWFDLILKVDGEEVPNSKSIEYKENQTPLLRSITPRYGRPGEAITINGRIFTKEYGNTNIGDEETVDPETMRDESITAVLIGSRECELTDDLGNVYGLTLDNSDSDEGTIKCLPGGSFIGPVNGTIFVSGQYGKSQISGAYSLNSKGQLFLYHTLPEITSVSPNMGGSNGGTYVTIQGNSFDSYPGKTKVMLGQTPCTVVSVTNSELICKTPDEDDVTGTNIGARGLKYEIWNATEDASITDTSAADYHTLTMDGSSVEGPYFNETNGFTARLSGYFVAPYTGNISFYLTASDAATLYLSSDTDPANKVAIVEHASQVTTATTGSPHSDPVAMEEGELYYIEAVHVQAASSAAENMLTISLWEHNTIWHESQTDQALDEVQTLTMKYDRLFETQRITFSGMNTSSLVTFTHAGIPAKDPVGVDSKSGWEQTFTEMMTYSCEYKNNRHYIKQDYEDTSVHLSGAGGTMQDAVQAYCGARALENQQRIFHSYSEDVEEIDANTYPWFCWAAKGASYQGRVSLRVLWEDNDDKDRYDWLHFDNIWTPTDEWSYQCFNMKESLLNSNISWIASHAKSGTDLDIQEIKFLKGDIVGKYYIDEVTVSRTETLITRKPPSLLDDIVMINTVTVETADDSDSYDVSLVPWTCNAKEDDINLFGLVGAEVVGLDTTGMSGLEAWQAQQDFLASTDVATFTNAEWGSGTVKIERITRGTRAMTGTFAISYDGKTIDLPAYPSDQSLAPALEAFGMVGVQTSYSGTKSQCYDRKLDIDFETSLGGDLSEMVIDTSNLVLENGNLSSTFMFSTSTDGGIMVDGPGGDFFRMPASMPTISVVVEGFLASCAAPDCTFSYDPALTPSLTSVTDSINNGAVELTITGTGFTIDTTDYMVMVGDLDCSVTNASETEIVCTLEAGAAGVYDLSVIVKSKGTADHPNNGTLTHEVTMEIFSNTPEQGSLGGGTTITVTGSGFPATLAGWSNGTVNLAGSECTVTASTFDEFQCITSAQVGGSRRKRSSTELTITIGLSTISGGSFEFSAALTPAVSAVSPTTSSPLGGDKLNIDGTAFGAQWGEVFLGEAKCSIITWFNTQITCTLPANTHGDYPVHVSVPGNGFADVSSVSGVSYNFIVTDMTPRKGSTMGGTKVKLTGSGFGNCSDVSISLGEMFTCDIQSCSDTEIICVTERVTKIHQVTNGGRHPTYGPGYVWSPVEVEIQPGDLVDWVWNLQVSSEETGISVHQVAGPSMDDWDGKGFKSERSANGRLQETLESPGTYYYSSQPVFGDSLFMKGTVKVVAPSSDTTVSLSVTMGDVPAAQQVVADSGSLDFGSCNITSSISCTEDPVSVETFLFTMAVCMTPIVSSVELTSGAQNMSSLPLEGFDGAELTIMGSGFSDNSCQNEVNLGDNGRCTISAVTSSSIVCTVDGSGMAPDHLPSLKPAIINVNIINSGNAILEVADPLTGLFNLIPKVTAPNSNSGSWAGGFIYVLSGSGLLPYGGEQTVFVTFGEAPYSMGCTIVEVAFDYISCLTPDFTAYKGMTDTSKTVPVTVNLGYDQISPILEGGNLTWTFDDAVTASADTMSPMAISSSETVVVDGSNFGNSMDVSIFLRNNNSPGKRRRREISENKEVINSVNIEKTETENAFWKNAAPGGIPQWRCPSGIVDCSHGSITAMNHNHGRGKREIPDNWEDLKQLEREDDDSLLNDICMTDDKKCAAMLNALLNEGSRKKRAANEEQLLEMALLTEGTYEAVVTAVNPTSITFTAPALPAGSYDVLISIPGQGLAMSSVGSLTSSMAVSSVNPAIGSVNGGQIVTVAGSGFCETSSGATTITIGTDDCPVQSVDPSTVICITPAGVDGSASLTVLSCGVSASSTYDYSTNSSPVISSISPMSASGANSLDLTGSNFGASPVVTVGSTDCAVTSSSNSTITCDLPGLPGGDYYVTVYNADLGLSNGDLIFTSTLEISSVTPTTGSFGGGTPLMINGTGFDSINMPTVKVCGNICPIVSITPSQINCLTPSNSVAGATEVCDVEVTQPSGNAISASAFTYDESLTPSITSSSPDRGGTGGGTFVTITGSGFASSGNKVTIDGSICDVSSENATEIQCYTNYHAGAIEAAVQVDVPNQGFAVYDDMSAAMFYYIDRWSSIWTWGGTGTPLAEEFIVITEGMTILLDESTPVLGFLLIKGGTLKFDSLKPEIELNSKYILLVDGGKLEVGTEEEPYESKAIITMHGNVRCTEMPVFGCKVIGVRNGTLDLHGEYVPVTWTHLAETVAAGETEITLKQPVTWKVGDHIAIATTGDRSSMKENEEHYIAAISADGYTITLEDPLMYQHISIEQTFGDHVVESRGEVALLTRNILVRGTMNEQFTETLPACEQEFNSGASMSDAMQTCFAGKFGEELGHDEMGAVIIISPKYKDQGLVEARIEYVEFTNVGQAFRVGRYPIHFHLPGNMSTSYIRGNAVHHSNNRACTLHDVSNMVVEHNVAFNVKGLTFFLEDGIEEYNTLQYNLAIFTRMSNSLLNPDINPASFWIVNANNKFRHNSCAGGTHFCFWLRPARVPDGPSYTMSYCPNKVNMDEFHNNTAHSMGWYGFWIFGRSNHASYDPHTGDVSEGYCNGERTQARIGSFTTWNMKRGFEIVSGANIRMENQIHMDNDFAGYEIFKAKGPYGDDGPGIFDTIIVGHSQISDLTPGKNGSCTPSAINLPPSGYTVKNVSFFNFDRDCSAMHMRKEESFETQNAARTEGLQFTNTPNKVFVESGEDHGMWFVDVDGSLTGTAGANLIGDSGTNPPSCTPDTTGELGEANLGGHQGSVCPGDVKFHRMMMSGESSPSAFKYNGITVRNQYGNTTRGWQKMFKGWEALLVQEEGNVNWITFDTSEHVTNISYSMEVSGMHPGGDNFILIGHELYQEPDRFTVLPGEESTNATGSLTENPTYDDPSGSWFFNNETGTEINEMVYILSDKEVSRRKKRSPVGEVGTSPSSNWLSAQFVVFRCFFENCIPPPPPTLPPGRPTNFHKWSNASAWAELGYTMPQEGDTVFIPPGSWMVMDIDPPPLRMIFVYGGLEIMDDADHILKVEIILVQGGKFQCGMVDEPHNHTFILELQGNHLTEDQPLPDGPNLGAKALGIFGFADMHGQDVAVSWTKLATTSSAGSVTLELEESVTWAAGSEVVVSTTSYELHETEKRTIASVSGTTITLTEALDFEHLGTEATLTDGTKFQMRAKVGLLTRNVKIVGNNYSEIEEEQFGGRVLVGEFEQDDIVYTGYARFSNVEFAVAGQEGWYDNYDPRYALAYLDAGTSTDGTGSQKELESFVKKCTFNYVYNSAIGLFGSNNIPVEDNVVFRFTNNGIFDEGIGNRINRNLVTMGESVARIKEQSFNIEFFGCINIKRATETVLMNNAMAGCAQAGLMTIGRQCGMNNSMSGNEAHGAQHGLHMDTSGVARPSTGCAEISDFYSWKNWDYGVQTKAENRLTLSNIRAIDNGVGLLPYGIAPSADAHQIEEKFITLTDSIIVAVSDVYTCNDEAIMPDIYQNSMEKKRRWTGRNKGMTGGRASHHTGIVWPIFQSSPGEPDMPWYKALKGAVGTNPALRGILNLNNVTFANFGENCGQSDVVLRTNFGDDDVNYPIKTTDIKFVDVDTKYKVYIDEPLIGKINPADCTDFDCDGLKKAMIFDDGTFAGDGNPGTIIPDSAFEWDGNPVRGLGDYRIPKPMVTELNGDKIEFEDKMPNKGIYRDDSCIWNDEWRAYKCQNINHRIMIIESMDRDSKIRRLSPIAILANAGSNGYIDLVNGPQDFSCCSGYTCAERLSTFFTMVATGLEYEVMFTSIPPQNFRIHMLHNDGGDAIRAKIWFPKQQRLDVYVDGIFRNPNNKDFSKEEYSLLPPGAEYVPEISEANGNNYFDPGTGHLYIIVKGPSTIEIKTMPIVVLKLGMTVPIENFFEENVVANLAGLLGIDPSNIRVTNIVREGSTGRKREAGEVVTQIQVDIGPPPQDTLVDFFPPEYTYTTPAGEVTLNPIYTTLSTAANTTTPWVEPPAYLNYDELINVQAQLANEFQTGTLNSALNITGLNVTSLTMEDPVKAPEAPPPYTSPEERAEVLPLTWAEQAALNNTALLEEYAEKTFALPDSLAVANQPDNVEEMAVMSPAPSVYARDEFNKMISQLGDDSDPWQCTVSVMSGPGGQVLGVTTVDFVGGIATFDEIYIDQAGSDYVLQFNVTYPVTDVGGATSLSFEVGGRPLSLKLDSESPLIPQNSSFTVSASVWDSALDVAAASSVLTDLSWDCDASISNGDLTGTTNIAVQKGSGAVVFDDLIVEQPGTFYDLTISCSSPEINETITATTAPFHVYDSPTHGMLEQTFTTFSFKGPWGEVQDIVVSAAPGTLKTCKNCPFTSRNLPSNEGQDSKRGIKISSEDDSDNFPNSPIEWRAL